MAGLHHLLQGVQAAWAESWAGPNRLRVYQDWVCLVAGNTCQHRHKFNPPLGVEKLIATRECLAWYVKLAIVTEARCSITEDMHLRPCQLGKGNGEKYLTLLPRKLSCSSTWAGLPFGTSLTFLRCVFIAISTPAAQNNLNSLSKPCTKCPLRLPQKKFKGRVPTVRSNSTFALRGSTCNSSTDNCSILQFNLHSFSTELHQEPGKSKTVDLRTSLPQHVN